MNKINILILLLLSQIICAKVDIKPKDGEVNLSLDNYNHLVENSLNPVDTTQASFAIGQTKIIANITETDTQTQSTIILRTTIEVFEDKWTLIPILPVGTAISYVEIDGEAIQLVQNNRWLAWNTNESGVYQLRVSYNIDAKRSDNGYVIAMPVIPSAASKLEVNFPAKEIDLAVVPSSNLKTQSNANTSKVTATIPSTSSVLISWHVPTKNAFIISRVDYSGELKKGVAQFQARYDIQLFSNESIKIPLMSNNVTLNEVSIDNKAATIMELNDQFSVILQGRGRHSVIVDFQAQVTQEQGPPMVSFPIPKVPISKFSLKLNGKKEVSVISNHENKAHVDNNITEESTTALVFLPMSEYVSFSWVDAVPKDLRTKLRANANIYHAISAEEGVLYVQAVIDYEITHGETTSLSFNLSSSVQVNKITSSTGGISDWNVADSENEKTITVFLDRALKSNYQLQINYEQLLDTDKNKAQAIDIPLIKANDMHRQRGIVALLAGSELALKPIKEINISRVGENQLPAFFRNQIKLTIAHTFKYTSNSPQLVAHTIAPERKQGKYDAQIDTLISLGEVSMRGSSGILIDVKSGAIVDLQLQLPQGINVLNVTGPSIRNHKIKQKNNTQNINIEFTQEMTGQFRIEINYEKILGENKSELDIPSLHVIGTEVQHGRIAVEALTAVEVQTAKTNQLSSLEINELPQQLVLKTTNPILLAFKYVNTDTPYELKLSMIRHQEIEVQVAAIESAHYQTLITKDGLAVTTATFSVKNSRRQFLRLNLPKDSEVWSVFVNGKAEKPAMASDDKNSNAILIKMLNSATGFPVVLVYASSIEKINMFGQVKMQLPTPDMVVTHSSWDVFLPIGPNYHDIKSNMNTVITGRRVNPQAQATKQNGNTDAMTQLNNPLKIEVPKQGIHYKFEKLYANRSNESAEFDISYSSKEGHTIGLILSVVSVILIWLAIFLLRAGKTSQPIILSVLIAGISGLLVSILYFHALLNTALWVALFGGSIYILTFLIPKILNWWNNKIES